jgi:hypothetical protein
MLVVDMRVGLRYEWQPYNLRIVDKLLGTSEGKGDCEADERKRIKERPSGLVTLKPQSEATL